MNTEQTIPEKVDYYDFLFRVGMWWRIIYGVCRLILASILLRLIGTPVSDIFYTVLHNDLVERHGDFLAQLLRPILDHMSFTVTYFLAIYLIFWGSIDIVLSFNLLRHKMWAYSSSMYMISAFMLYEVYRFFHTHSFLLAYIIFFDFFVMWLIKKEFQRHRRTFS